jgi:hypothetical protein
VATCRQVERGEYEQGKRTFFVEADNDAGAKALAYQLYREAQKRGQRNRRARYLSEGRCPECGDKPEPPFKRCVACRTSNRHHHKHGRPTAPKSVAIAAKRKSREDAVRLATFKDVLRAWHTKSAKSFLVWLESNAGVKSAGLRSVA